MEKEGKHTLFHAPWWDWNGSKDPLRMWQGKNRTKQTKKKKNSFTKDIHDRETPFPKGTKHVLVRKVLILQTES